MTLYNTLTGLNAKSGDTVVYNGERYLYINNIYYRYDPISWVVISGNDSEALLISEYVLDNHSYGTVNDMCVAWKDSDLRRWLNDDFLKNAFTDEEQKCIYLKEVGSCDGSTENIVITSEKVSLPSHEVVYDFPLTIKQGIGTDYSGIGNHDYHTRCLKSYYGVWNYPMWVTSDCNFNTNYPANWSRGVRPLISVNLNQAKIAEKQRNEDKEKTKIKDFTKASVTLSKSSYKYDGKEKTPSITVKYNGKKLSTSDYIVQYSDNKNVGTATVTVTGKGDYKGSIKKTFSITLGKKIKITLNAMYGSPSYRTIFANQGGKIGGLVTPKRTGYSFKGWFTKSKGGTQYTSKSIVTQSKNFTLYAHWVIKYNITFVGNGADAGSMKTIKNIGYDTKQKLPANSFVRTGYKFLGWSKSAKATKATYKNKATITGLSKVSNSTVKLYAVWQEKTYSINFSANGGKGSMEALNGRYTKLIGGKLPQNQFIYEKKKFNGWCTDNGTIYQEGTNIRDILGDGNVTEITLSAQWIDDIFSCKDFISNLEHANYIDHKINMYMSDSRVKDEFDAGRSIIFMFEGGSDNYPSNEYSTSFGVSSKRNQAVVIVIKKGNEIQFNKYCSSIPDCINNPYIKKNDSNVSIYDGIYTVYYAYHKKVPALNVRTWNGDGEFSGLYFSDEFSGWRTDSCNAIDIHNRSRDSALGRGHLWGESAFSEGCQLIGRNLEEFNEFMGWVSAPGGFRVNEKAGIYILDRQLAKAGLISIYGSAEAVEALTAGSR